MAGVLEARGVEALLVDRVGDHGGRPLGARQLDGAVDRGDHGVRVRRIGLAAASLI